MTVLKTVANNAAFQNLPSKDQQFVRDMLTAAESNQLSAFISTNGYSSVLQIIECKRQLICYLLSYFYFN